MTHDGEPDSYEYASRLATWIWEKHYKNESPHWKPLNDLLGVLTQIDNMVTGLVRAQPEQEIEPDRPHVEDDGCPTEKAVLQRFWREHQKQEPVAWMHPTIRDCVSTQPHSYKDAIPLYTTPPQRKWQGLTDEEYESMAEKYVTNYFFDTLKYARAIETKLRVKNGNV